MSEPVSPCDNPVDSAQDETLSPAGQEDVSLLPDTCQAVPSVEAATSSKPAMPSHPSRLLTRSENKPLAQRKRYSITGGFPSMRVAFEERDFILNEVLTSQDWQIRYGIRKKDVDFPSLDDSQAVNYFPTNHEYTTKISLTQNLFNCCWMNEPDDEGHHGRVGTRGIDMDCFYPRCYNLSVDSGSFVEDFKRGKCLAVLKTWLVAGEVNPEVK